MVCRDAVAGFMKVALGAVVVGCAVPAAAWASPPLDENARVTATMAKDVPAGASTGTIGALVQQYRSDTTPVTAPPVVDTNSRLRFEVASAVKIVLAVALERKAEDAGKTVDDASLNLSWFDYAGNGIGDSDDARYLCPSYAKETPANRYSVSYADALDDMMRWSNNTYTRAVLLEVSGATAGLSGQAPWSSSAVTGVLERAGVTDTTLSQDLGGCGFVNGNKNLSTLTDLSRVWSSLDTGKQVTDTAAVINHSVRGGYTDALEAVVDEEAQKLGAAGPLVTAFKQQLATSFKGGSYLLSCTGNAATQSDVCTPGEQRRPVNVDQIGYQQVPFMRDGQLRKPRYTVGTSIVDRLCPDTAQNHPCYDAANAQVDVGFAEALRSLVHDGLVSYMYPDDDPPVSAFTPPAAVAGTAAAFDGTGSTDDVAVSTYQWDFGDGSAIATGATPVHAYAAAGTYTVRLRTVDSVGNSDTAERQVTVSAPATPDPVPSPTASPDPAPADRTPPKLTLKRVKAKQGKAAKLTVTSSEGATVKVTVTRTVTGRRKAGRCVASKRKPPKAKRCSRKQAVSTTTARIDAGRSTVTLHRSARLSKGRYAVTVVATDAAGNRATARTQLTVTPKRR